MNFLIRVHIIFLVFICLLVTVAFIASNEEEEQPYTPYISALYTAGTPVPKDYSRGFMEHDLRMYCQDLSVEPQVYNSSAYYSACLRNEAWGRGYIGYGD